MMWSFQHPPPHPITLSIAAIPPNEPPLWTWRPALLLQGPIRGPAPASHFPQTSTLFLKVLQPPPPFFQKFSTVKQKIAI